MRRQAGLQLQAARQTSTSTRSDTKFHPGIDPLEQEEQLQHIMPLSEEERALAVKYLERMETTAKSEVERKCITFQRIQMQTSNVKDTAKQEFLRAFWAWLLGRGSEQDSKRTPWGRQSLAHDAEIAAYIDAFVTKAHQYRLKLKLMTLRQPVGIAEAYLYFKYIVRGAEPSSTQYLADWELMQSQYMPARDAGNEKWQPDPNHFHEMAPYGDQRKLAAAQISKVAVQEENEKFQADDDVVVATVVPPPPPVAPKMVKTTVSAPAMVRTTQPVEEVQVNLEDDEETEDMVGENELMLLRKYLENTREEDIRLAKESNVKQEQVVGQLQEQIRLAEEEIKQAKLAKMSADESAKRLNDLVQQQQETKKLQQQNLEVLQKIEASLQQERQQRQEDLKQLLAAAPKQESKELQQYQHDMATFQKNFAAFMSAVEARMRELEQNRANLGQSDVLIEEVKEQTEQLKLLQDTIAQQGKHNLEAAQKLQEEIGKRESQVVVAESANASEVLQKLEQQTKMSEENIRAFSTAFAENMKKMMDAFMNQNRAERDSARAQMENMLKQIPVNNAAETRKMYADIEAMMHNLQKSQDTLRLTENEGEHVKELRQQVEQEKSNAATWRLRAEQELAEKNKLDEAARQYLNERVANLTQMWKQRMSNVQSNFQQQLSEQEKKHVEERRAFEAAARQVGTRLQLAEEAKVNAEASAVAAIKELPEAAKIAKKNEEKEKREEKERREQLLELTRKAKERLQKVARPALPNIVVKDLPTPAAKPPKPAAEPPKAAEPKEKEEEAEKQKEPKRTREAVEEAEAEAANLSAEMEVEEELSEEEVEAFKRAEAKTPKITRKKKSEPVKVKVEEFKEEELEHVQFGLRQKYKAMRKVEKEIEQMDTEKDAELEHLLAFRSTKPKVIDRKIAFYKQYLKKVGKKAALLE